jgi:hypothetical protein
LLQVKPFCDQSGREKVFVVFNRLSKGGRLVCDWSRTGHQCLLAIAAQFLVADIQQLIANQLTINKQSIADQSPTVHRSLKTNKNHSASGRQLLGDRSPTDWRLVGEHVITCRRPVADDVTRHINTCTQQSAIILPLIANQLFIIADHSPTSRQPVAHQSSTNGQLSYDTQPPVVRPITDRSPTDCPLKFLDNLGISISSGCCWSQLFFGCRRSPTGRISSETGA